MRFGSYGLGLLAVSAAFLMVWAISSPSPLPAQTGAVASDAVGSAPLTGVAVSLGTTPPLRSIGPRPFIPGHGLHLIPFHRRPFELGLQGPQGPNSGGGAGSKPHHPPTPAPPPTPTSSPMPSPSLTFSGANNAENSSLNGSILLPPDTEGAVGPNDYVEVVNLLINVYDKGGGLLVQESMGALFGFTTCGIEPLGDPIVAYDARADRWLITQIAGQSFPSLAPPFFECVAISTSSDPTGAYNLYSIQIPNNWLNDYPKWAVWSDGYYMSTNLFDVTVNPNTFHGVGVFAWDRNALLAGSGSVTVIEDTLNLGPGVSSMLPAQFDGAVPPAGEPEHFMTLTAPQFGAPDTSDSLRIFDFHADFITPANSTFQERAESPIAVAAFNPVICADVNGNCVPQPGTSQKLEVLSDRLMHRLQYRNLGSTEALVVNHTVAGPAGQAAIRYYDLRSTSLGGTFAIHDQATYAPDGNHRWMGSAAMDHHGNLAVGYSVSSGSVSPSIRYAGRLAGQTGGLTQGEASLIKGGGSQTDGSDRWGDYSALMIDPSDDCTFWYTNEYYSTTSQYNWQTEIGSFKFPACP